MSSKIDIVTVINNFDLYKKCIEDNSFLKKENINKIHFDNTKENISISKRYNSYLKDYMQKDIWICFIHQDFVFEDCLEDTFKDLDECYLYGVVGGGWINGNIKIVGQIFEGQDRHTTGEKVGFKTKVDTFDCCCLIVNSNLIYKHNILFDEFYNFHAYIEDFCLSYKTNRDVNSYVLPIKAWHIGTGSTNDDFYKSYKYLKNKFKFPFSGTMVVFG